MVNTGLYTNVAMDALTHIAPAVRPALAVDAVEMLVHVHKHFVLKITNLLLTHILYSTVQAKECRGRFPRRRGGHRARCTQPAPCPYFSRYESQSDISHVFVFRMQGGGCGTSGTPNLTGTWAHSNWSSNNRCHRATHIQSAHLRAPACSSHSRALSS